MSGLPARTFLERPKDDGSFVLPLKQNFIRDARIMLALLAGWAGTGRPLQLTQGTIARHLQKSVRQVFRYLKDAKREGYLNYAYRKNRLGMITGVIIHLSFPLLRPLLKGKPLARPAIPDRTLRADTNTLFKDSYYMDPEIKAALDRFRQTVGFSAT